MKRSITLGVALAAILLSAAPAGLAKTVNSNTDNLPPGCDEISEEIEMTVRGGSEFARNFTGVAYSFEEHSFEVPTCALVTVTFNNTDEIRHQFMPHGTWPNGFTLIEVDGPGEDTASFITPGNPTTLMIHCGVNQHQQKGMKAQLVVGGGSGDIPNIPGVSGLPPEDRAPEIYGAQDSEDDELTTIPSPSLAAGLVALALVALVRRRG